MNKLLIEKFPNLSEVYNNEVDWQEGDETGSHTVYGDVFTPYIVKCIEDKRTMELKTIFEFIESVLVMQDDYTNEVIAFSVVESIKHQINKKLECKDLMGTITKKYLESFKYILIYSDTRQGG